MWAICNLLWAFGFDVTVVGHRRLEFIGDASRYIHTHYYAYANAFIVYSIQVFSSHDDKV